MTFSRDLFIVCFIFLPVVLKLKWASGMIMHWRRKWQPTPVFLFEKSYGQKNLTVYSPKGHKELDTAE